MLPTAATHAPPSPPQAEEDRRAAILRAAFEVFARDGFHGASIKAIAAQARLKSPALIYWYFKDKNELFERVLVECSPVITAVPNLLGLMDEPPQTVLPLVAQAYLALCDMPEGERMFRLVVGEMAHHPELAERLALQGFSKFQEFLVAYLRRQVKLGRLRPHDPHAGAASLVGPLFMYLFARSVLPVLAGGLPAGPVFARQVVATFLQGLAAPQAPGAPPVASPKIRRAVKESPGSSAGSASRASRDKRKTP